MDWTGATKGEVLAAVQSEVSSWPPDVASKFRNQLLDPHPVLLDRRGTKGAVFVVARVGEKVAYYDDVEEDFCTGKLIGIEITDVSMFGNLAWALESLGTALEVRP